MILKPKAKTLKKKNLLQKLLILYFFFTFSIGAMFLVLFFSSYTVKVKSSKLLDYLSRGGRIEYINIFKISWMALQSKFQKFDRIDLEIKFEDIIKLEQDRALAIERGTLGINDRLTEVKVKVIYQNKKHDARIRLKGGRAMHWEDKSKSSYNFYLKKGQYIKGMRTFTIHKPGLRNYIHEWIYHEMIGDMGLIKSNYDFFHLYINGDNQGLYALEEKMSKEIIERNKRRNGPIFTGVNFISKRDKGIDALKIYNEKFWSRPENIELAKVATNKLADFLEGKRGIENTFDLEKMAAFFAVMDATYMMHSLPMFNSKLYYNPINGLFEPVPRDGHRELPNYHKFNSDYYKGLIIDSLDKPETFESNGINHQLTEERWFWINKFFNKDGEININFYNLYLKYLNKISKKEYYQSFLEKRKKKIYSINSNIYGDYFFYATSQSYTNGIYYFSENDLIFRFKDIQRRLETIDKSFFVRLKEENLLEIRVVYPYYNSPLREIKLSNITLNKIFCNNSKPILLEKQLEIHSNTFINLSGTSFDENNCKEIELIDNILNKNYFVKIDELNNRFKFNEFKDFKDKTYLNYFKQKDNKLFLKSEEILISQNLYIPKGMIVILNSGQKLILTNNAFIISDSPWIVNGESQRISITGLSDNFGGGIIINNIKKKSYFNNVKFSYLAGYKNDFLDQRTNKRYGTKTHYSTKKINVYGEEIFEKNLKNSNSEFIILGALNIHQSDVDLSKIIFDKISSEDALNIINSKFNINNVEFIENASDSMDFDFSDGKIDKVKFLNIGNDAIDFSGSNANISNIYFENVSDKLISVGEDSNVKISNIKANKSYVGIASKDGSTVVAENIFMKNVILPFTSFNKKFEYSTASLYLKNIDVINFHKKWITDESSKIYLDNSSVGKIIKEIIPVIYEKDINLLNKTSN